MPDGLGGTVLRRQIGRMFTKLRTRAGMTMEQAAKRMDIGRTTLTRIEDGDSVRFKDAMVRDWLNLFGATPEESDLVLSMTTATRDSANRGWWQSHTSSMPKWFTLFVALQDASEEISQYETELIPGLLQTRAYAQELFRIAAGYPDDVTEIDRLTEIRMERQSLLTRARAPRLDAVLSEAVLHRPVGGAAVMNEQLQALITRSRQANVSVRILPYSAGGHAAMGGAFTILDFPDGPDGAPIEPTLAYTDSFAGSIYLNGPEELAIYRFVWTDVVSKALDTTASRELIIKMMEEEWQT